MEELICIKCGGRVDTITYATNPPITKVQCSKCGRIISEDRAEITIRKV